MKQIIAALSLTLALAGNALALEKEPYSEERFAALTAAGEVVLVDVFADWCSTCKRQQEIIKEYRAANPDKAFHILEVNFDSDKQLVRQLRAPRQSTLLLYSGESQFWYSVAETRPEVIAAELDKAIKAAQ
jgi:thioredoxin 1